MGNILKKVLLGIGGEKLYESLEGKKEPELQVPQQIQIPSAPQYKSSEEIFQQAINYMGGQFPSAMGARESALKDISRGNEYYQQFQPTSFENMLMNYANSIGLEQAKRIAGQRASVAGIETIFPELFMQSAGPTITNIGEYFANLSNQRATSSLNARLGIDPMGMINPYAETNLGQSNLQTGSDYENALLKEQTRFQYDLMKAQSDYQNALKKYQQSQAKISSLSSLAGAGIGFMVGGPAGMSIGAGIGGTAGSLFGGGEAPMDMGTALQLYNSFSGSGKTTSPTAYNNLLGKSQAVNSNLLSSDISKYYSY